MRIIAIPTLKDNLTYVVHRESSRDALVIDPSEAAPVILRLERENLDLKLILNTHHHHDHVGGNGTLVEKFGVDVWCSKTDLDRVPRATRGLEDGERLAFDGLEFTALAIPGHTRGQLAYHFEAAKAVFVGDTLFSLGCGRLYEGTAAELWSSLQRLMKLPEDTRLYFGHEYTERNAEFALAIDPGNEAIEARRQAVRKALATEKVAPAPTLLEECKVNPFLRPRAYAGALGIPCATDLEAFTELRRRRDAF